MTGKREHKFDSIYGPNSRVYAVGPWDVLVNKTSRAAQITSGDIWYNISRQEAANWLRFGQPTSARSAA